jgi:CHAT domain-containing protein/tetratricopeptide (TPR) repeat protein
MEKTIEYQALIDALLACPSPQESRSRLAEWTSNTKPGEVEALAAAFKQNADELMRANIQRCLLVCDLMDSLVELGNSKIAEALALLARGNAHAIGLGEFRQGVECYNRAAGIYAAEGLVVKQAEAQIGKIYALANLGRYEQALTDGNWARSVLRSHGEWLNLARLKVNLAIVHGRMGQDSEALELFDLAKQSYQRLGAQGEANWPRVELNRAVVLRNLGRFEEAIQASQAAMEMQKRLGLRVSAAVAQQSLGVTYFGMGRYNEALEMLDQARQVFLQDGRPRHAMMVELFTSDCLLQLRRFTDVLEKSQRMRLLFSQIGNRYEVGEAILNEASAYKGLGRFSEAQSSLSDARQIFSQEGNPVAVAEADLLSADVSLQLGRPQEALHLAQGSQEVFASLNLPVYQARALLLTARAELDMSDENLARSAIQQVLQIGAQQQLPSLTFPAHHLLAQLAEYQGQPRLALEACDQAIQDLERLCGRLMVEFRASFVEDKQSVYEDAVALCLEQKLDERGLDYAERARSRALLDMLAYRLDMTLTPRSEADIPITRELKLLQAERDHLYRRWQSGDGFGQRGQTADLSSQANAATGQAGAAQGSPGSVQRRILAIEKQITDLWHTLLIHSADYAQEAALWQVRSEPIQPFLPDHKLLLEYFSVHDRLVVFLVSAGDLRVVELPATMTQVQRLVQLTWLNLRSVQSSAPERLPALIDNIQGVLSKLYTLLIEPFAGDLDDYAQLTVVPHGPLHYLPFQSLYAGDKYLIDCHEINYLPGASMLRYLAARQPVHGPLSALGHSYQGALPFTVHEANAIAAMWQDLCGPGQSRLFLEEGATLENLRRIASDSRILHLATHGDFRLDNPLFSGLALEDGWLTTLEIFNLRLNASLVTLSACQTGRNVIGGGEELLGLMRAMLAAGAASLLSTLWAVDDRSTAQLMTGFYRRLADGESKGAALCQAQLEMLHADAGAGPYRHPYYWAPFYLVGDAGPV